MPLTSPEILGLCCELVDAAQVLAPRGWKKLEVSLDNRGGQLRVTQLDAQLDEAPPPKPELGIDADARLGGMSAAFTDLLHALHHEGVDWAGTRAALNRPAPNQLTVSLPNPDGHLAAGIGVPPEFLDALFISEQLLTALAETEPKLEEMQRRTKERLSDMVKWSYSQPEKSLTFDMVKGPPLKLRAQIIGMWADADESWLWGWANSAIEPGCTNLIDDALQPHLRQTGFAALWREKYPCDEGFGAKIALYAAYRADAKGVYRGRVGPAWAYFALME